MAALFGGMITGVLMVIFYGYLLLQKGESDLTQVLILNVAAFAIGELLAALALAAKIRPLRGDGTIAAREILAISWPMLAATVTNIILLRADLWILGMFVPDEQVAVYGAAARIITVVTIPLTMASGILGPMIAELHTQGKKQQLERVLRGMATLGGLPAVAAILVFVLFGGPGLELIYGDALYRGGWLVLVALSLGQLVHVWSGVSAQLLMMTGHHKPVMHITLGASALAVLGAVVCVRPFGIHGVAIAFASGVALQSLGMVVYARRALGMKSYMLVNPMGLRGLMREIRETARQGRDSRRQARADRR
jgi:O-antigen/teichoic acid export membrane protein